MHTAVSDSDERTSILERLERAESELKTIRRVARGVVVAVLVGVPCLLGFAVTRPAASQLAISNPLQRGTRLRAPVVISDKQGRPIVQVLDKGGVRGLLVFDEAGNVITGVGQNADGKGVAVFETDGKVVSGLGITAKGRGLTVFDAQGETATWVGVGNPGPDQGRGVLVRDETGAPVAKLGVVDAPDRGEVILQNRAGDVLFRQPAP
jgi:hypothetical protein